MAKMKTTTIIIIAAVLVVGFLLFSGKISLPGGSNVVDGECIPSSGETIGVCCYDQNKEPISCGNQGTAAIYQGTPGIYFIQHAFRIDNTGNVDLNAYINSATCKDASGVSNPECEGSYSSIIGTGNTKLVTQGNFESWSGTLIDLQQVPTGTYDVAVEICAQDTASELTEVCKTSTTQFTTEPEGIDFTVGITV